MPLATTLFLAHRTRIRLDPKRLSTALFSAYRADPEAPTRRRRLEVARAYPVRPSQPEAARRPRYLAHPAWIERVAETVAEQVERQRGREDREPRPEHQPRLSQVVLRPGREQVPPTGNVLVDAEPEKREARLQQDVLRNRQGRVDDDRRDEVRDDVRTHDPAVAGADHPRSLDELLLSQREHLGPHDSCRIEPTQEAEPEHQRHDPLGKDPEGDVVEARTDGRAQRDDEEQRREDHRLLDHTRDRGIDPPPVIPGKRTEQDPDQHHPDRREHSHLERDPGAVEQAEELVVAELAVRPEDVELLGRRVRDAVRRRNREPAARDVRHRPDRERLDAVAAGILVEVVRAVPEEVGSDRTARDRGEDQQDDEDAAADRHLVAPEAPPDLLPVSTGANLFDLAELTVRLDRDRRRKSGL